MSETHWRIADFRPATDGWRLVSLSDSAPWYRVWQLVGWVIEEEIADRDGFGYRQPTEELERRIVAARCEEGQITPIADYEWLEGSAWFVLGPDQPEPSAAEAKEEWGDRELRRLKRIARRKAAASP